MLQGPATTDIKDAQLRGRFDLDALRGPAITEIAPPHLRGRCRLNRQAHLVLSLSTPIHVNAWEFAGNRCGNTLGKWEPDRISGKPAPGRGPRRRTRRLKPPPFEPVFGRGHGFSMFLLGHQESVEQTVRAKWEACTRLLIQVEARARGPASDRLPATGTVLSAADGLAGYPDDCSTLQVSAYPTIDRRGSDTPEGRPCGQSPGE